MGLHTSEPKASMSFRAVTYPVVPIHLQVHTGSHFTRLWLDRSSPKRAPECGNKHSDPLRG